MEKRRLILTGALVLLAIFLLVWGINFLKGDNIFKKDNKFYGEYQRIEGLRVSSPVMLNGFKIGQVSKIHFKPDNSGKLILEFLILEQYPIYADAKAEIFSVDLMGSKGVRIIQDFSQNHAKLNSGDTLISSIESSFKDEVNMQILPLKKKAEEMISSFDTVLTAMRAIFDTNMRKNLSNSFKSVRISLKTLEHTTFTLDTIMEAEKSTLARIMASTASIVENVENNNVQITNTIQNLSNFSDTLAKADFISVIKNTEKAVADIQKITDKINAGEGSMGMLIHNDTLYQNLENSSYNLNRLLRDMRENPKRYVRFSAFDLGKTVIYEKKRKKKKGK